MKQDIVTIKIIDLIKKKAEGMELSMLASISGVSEKAIVKALSGETNPHSTTLNKLITALSISDEEIKEAVNG